MWASDRFRFRAKRKPIRLKPGAARAPSIEKEHSSKACELTDGREHFNDLYPWDEFWS